ncbi:MAG: helix-hairpin-helix domain-containing protein [Phycisphaeraceae bacterium]
MPTTPEPIPTRPLPPLLAPGLALVALALLAGLWTARPATRAGIEPRPLEHRLDVNAAPQHELELLPGVGPGIAWRIIDHRARVGQFHHVGQLEDVPLIGPVRRRDIEPWVDLPPAPR